MNGIITDFILRHKSPQFHRSGDGVADSEIPFSVEDSVAHSVARLTEDSVTHFLVEDLVVHSALDGKLRSSRF
nr:unnamed protein product [Haemonchus contortus]